MTVAVVSGRCPLCGPTAPRKVIAQGIDFEYGVTGDQEFTVAACGCGVRFLDPRPADHEIAGLYPDDYEPYRFDRLPAPVRAGRMLIQLGKVRLIQKLVPPDARIVDLGCGAGALLRLLRRWGKPGWQLCGWDFPGPHLDRLRQAGIDVIAGPVTPSLAPQADLFILTQVIEHFADPDRVLSVLASSLRPGGRILLETPDTDGLDAQLFSARHWGGYHFPRHLVLFNHQTLIALIEKSGLVVEKVESLPSPAFWVQSAHHALVDRGAKRLSSLFTLSNPLLVAAATAFDLARSPFFPTTNLRLVARKP